MKRILHKLFPKYFNVKYTKEIDFEKYLDTLDDDSLEALEIALINEDSLKINEALGISDERSEELSRKVRSAYIEFDSYTQAIKFMGRNDCCHINELVWCIVVIADQRAGNNLQAVQSFLQGPPPGF